MTVPFNDLAALHASIADELDAAIVEVLETSVFVTGHAVGAFPHAETFANECLSLPIFPGITAAQQQQVADALGAAVEKVA